MKVVLVAANPARTPYPVYPLGMAMVGSALKSAGHEVVQIDLLQEGLSAEAVGELVRRESPGVVGISIRNIDNVNLLNEKRYVDATGDLVQAIRRVSNATIVLGGSGFSILPEQVLRRTGADYGIVGEGEAAVVSLVAGVERGVFPEQRILREQGPALKGTEIPTACYDRRLMEFYLRHGNMASVQTKRGCEHHCSYCTYPGLEGSHWRCRDPRAVVDDVEMLLAEYNPAMLVFTDSVFNDDEGHYIEVLKEMKRRGVRVPWTAFFRPAAIPDAEVSLMRDTGLRGVELGSDGASDATLRGLGKSFTFADVVECDSRFARHGVPRAHYFMFGCPGETENSVREGIRNVITLKGSVSFMFMGIRIFPGTGIERQAIRDGVIAPGQDLLEPAYYIAPGIDRDWLERTLRDAFRQVRHCIFPADAVEEHVQLLHKLGHTGLLWDMLAATRRARA